MRKKIKVLALIMVVAIGVTACSKKSDSGNEQSSESGSNQIIINKADNSGQPESTNNTQETVIPPKDDAATPTMSPTETPTPEPVPDYGCLKTVVDTYGFPIYIRMNEGMEQTFIELSENTAKREWMSNVDYKVFENLTWKIDNKHLTISGNWSEEFEINPDTWTAASSLGGKDYSVCIYDKDGVFIFLDR